MYNPSSKKVTAFILVLLVVFQANVYGAMNSASLILRILRNPLVKAINSNEHITDADPFISAVIGYLEGNEERAAGMFIEGLIINGVKDPVQAQKVLKSIGGVATTASVALALAGQSEVAGQISSFVSAMNRSDDLDRWANAVKEGKEVTYKNGELVVDEKEKVVVEEKQAPEQQAGYVKTREDEVLPLLNIRHGLKGATVYVDGEEVDVSKQDEYMFEDLSAGKHIIKIATKYQSGSVQVFVNPKRETQSGFDQVDLDINWGTTKLKVDPGIKGLSVYLDDTLIGKTPFNETIKSGEYELKIESPWITDYSSQIEALPEKEISLQPQLEMKGALSLQGDIPTSADVKLNSEPVEWKYSAVYKLPGEYDLTIEDETIFPYEQKVSFTAYQKKSLAPDINFRTGDLRLKGQLSQHTTLYLDGEPIGDRYTGEGLIKDVVIGQHVLAFVHPLLEDPVPVEVSIQENEETVLEPQMATLVLEEIGSDIDVFINQTILDKGIIDSFQKEEQTARLYVPVGTYEIEYQGKYIKNTSLSRELKAGQEVVVQPDLQRYGQLVLQLTGSGESYSNQFHVDVYPQAAGEKPSFADMERINAGLRVRFTESTEFAGRDMQKKTAKLLLPPGMYRLDGYFEDDEPSYQNVVNIRSNVDLPLIKIPIEHSDKYKLAQLEKSLQIHKRKTAWGWSMTGISAVGAAAAGYFYYLANDAYVNYDSATTSANAEKYWNEVDTNTNLMWAGAGASAGAFLIGSIIFLARSDRDAIETKIEQLKSE